MESIKIDVESKDKCYFCGRKKEEIQHVINKRGVQYKTALAGIPVSLINRINKRGEDLNTKIPVINPIRRNTIVNRIETPFLLEVMEEPSLSTYNTTYVPNIGEGVGQLSEGAFAARYLYKYFYVLL